MKLKQLDELCQLVTQQRKNLSAQFENVIVTPLSSELINLVISTGGEQNISLNIDVNLLETILAYIESLNQEEDPEC